MFLPACKPNKTAAATTATTANSRRYSVVEIADASRTTRVDEQRGVIFGVKVLGLESGNTGRTIGLSENDFGDAVNLPYRYSLEAMRAATRLYEGVGVYLDHPDFQYMPNGSRSVVKKDRKTEDRFGWLENVRVQPDGLYADLHYFKSHKTAPLVVEAAQRRPEMLCLSHNAEAIPQLVGGRIVITKIESVRSVDLIGDRGGTTRSLFESESSSKRRTMSNENPKSIKAYIESLADKAGRATRLLEIDGLGDVMAEPMTDEVADDATVDDKVKAAFDEACIAVIHSDMSAAEKIAKLTEIINAQDGIDGGSTSTESTAKPSESLSHQPAAGGGGASSPAGSSPGSATASTPAVQIVDRAPLILESVAMLQTAGHSAAKPILEAMALLPDTAARQSFVDSLPKPAPAGVGLPRSQSPAKPVTTTTTESAEDRAAREAATPKSHGEFIDSLRGVR